MEALPRKSVVVFVVSHLDFLAQKVVSLGTAVVAAVPAGRDEA